MISDKEQIEQLLYINSSLKRAIELYALEVKALRAAASSKLRTPGGSKASCIGAANKCALEIERVLKGIMK